MVEQKPCLNAYMIVIFVCVCFCVPAEVARRDRDEWISKRAKPYAEMMTANWLLSTAIRISLWEKMRDEP